MTTAVARAATLEGSALRPSQRVSSLLDEFPRVRGCEPLALATLCLALPREELLELLQLLVRQHRQQADELHQLRAERGLVAAKEVQPSLPLRSKSRGYNEYTFMASRSTSMLTRVAPPLDLESLTEELHATRHELLASSSKELSTQLQQARPSRPSSAKPPRKAALTSDEQHQRRSRLVTRDVAPLQGWGTEEGNELLRVSSAPTTRPPSGLRSVHALHTHMLRSGGSLALSRTAATASGATVRRAASPEPSIVPPHVALPNRRQTAAGAAAAAASGAEGEADGEADATRAGVGAAATPAAAATVATGARKAAAPAAGAALGAVRGCAAAAAAAAPPPDAKRQEEEGGEGVAASAAVVSVVSVGAPAAAGVAGAGTADEVARWHRKLLPLLHELVGKVQAMLVGGGEALNTSEHDELAMRCMESLQQIIASPPVSRLHTEKQLEVVQQLLAQCAASPQAPTAIAASSSAEVTLQRLLRHAADLDSTNSSKAPTPEPLRKATGGTAPAEHADASKA